MNKTLYASVSEIDVYAHIYYITTAKSIELGMYTPRFCVVSVFLPCTLLTNPLFKTKLLNPFHLTLAVFSLLLSFCLCYANKLEFPPKSFLFRVTLLLTAQLNYHQTQLSKSYLDSFRLSLGLYPHSGLGTSFFSVRYVLFFSVL